MTISFDSDRHEVLVDSLRSATNAIAAELETLDDEVGSLRSSWSGSARDAYDDAHASWSACMHTLHSVLAQADDAATNAGAALQQAEHTVRALWN